MSSVEIIRVALQSIRANAFRAALTMLGVIIGVAAVITMVALGTGAQRSIDAQLEALGSNVLSVSTGRWFLRGVARDTARLTTSDAEALATDVRFATAVVPEINLRGQIKFGNRNINARIVGTTPSYAEVHGFRLAHGRMFSRADNEARRRVVVLGGEIPANLDAEPLSLLGQTIMIRSVPFEVVGIFEEKGSIGFSSPDDDVWIPLTTAEYRVAGSDRLQTISIQVADGVSLELALVDIEHVLRREHGILPGRDNDFGIYDRKQFLNARQQATGVFTFLLAGIAGVSLLVGGIGIMNIMLVTVTERTREIGIRKAFGATRTNILIQFLVESTTLCVIGGLLGIGLGAGLADLLARFAGWQTAVSASAVLLAFGFSAGVGLLFGIWPAQRAARLDPIEALRYE